jgi:hypothetical protein
MVKTKEEFGQDSRALSGQRGQFGSPEPLIYFGHFTISTLIILKCVPAAFCRYASFAFERYVRQQFVPDRVRGNYSVRAVALVD